MHYLHNITTGRESVIVFKNIRLLVYQHNITTGRESVIVFTNILLAWKQMAYHLVANNSVQFNKGLFPTKDMLMQTHLKMQTHMQTRGQYQQHTRKARLQYFAACNIKIIFFFKSGEIYMKDLESAESKEKPNFRSWRFLFFEFWSVFLLKMITIFKIKNRNKKLLRFSFC